MRNNLISLVTIFVVAIVIALAPTTAMAQAAEKSPTLYWGVFAGGDYDVTIWMLYDEETLSQNDMGSYMSATVFEFEGVHDMLNFVTRLMSIASLSDICLLLNGTALTQGCPAGLWGE